SSSTRELATWFVPDAWLGPVSELHYRLTRRNLMRRLAPNTQLAGRHRNERRCFVIGNGPSLNTQDLSLLADEFTIIANIFFQHPDVDRISPAYCCVGDPDFVSDTPNAIAWLRELESKLPHTTLFFRPWAPDVFQRHNLFLNHTIHYLDSVAKVPHPSQVHL